MIGETRLLDTGTVPWWHAAADARPAFTAHFSREEAVLLAEICGCLEPREGAAPARHWAIFVTAVAHR